VKDFAPVFFGKQNVQVVGIKYKDGIVRVSVKVEGIVQCKLTGRGLKHFHAILSIISTAPLMLGDSATAYSRKNW